MLAYLVSMHYIITMRNETLKATKGEDMLVGYKEGDIVASEEAGSAKVYKVEAHGSYEELWLGSVDGMIDHTKAATHGGKMMVSTVTMSEQGIKKI